MNSFKANWSFAEKSRRYRDYSINYFECLFIKYFRRFFKSYDFCSSENEIQTRQNLFPMKVWEPLDHRSPDVLYILLRHVCVPFMYRILNQIDVSQKTHQNDFFGNISSSTSQINGLLFLTKPLNHYHFGCRSILLIRQNTIHKCTEFLTWHQFISLHVD